MNNKFKYKFSIARFMPDQVRGEFVNVGIILHLTEAKLLYSKWLPEPNRLRCLSPGFTVEQYKYFQATLSERYNLGYSTPTLGSPDTIIGENISKHSPDLLDYLYKEWSVPFQFSEPVAGFTADPRKQLEHLYTQLVQPVYEEKLPASSNTRLDKIKRKLERALSQANLLGPEKITKDLNVPGTSINWQFDYGRANGRLTLLQTVSLAQKSALDKSNAAALLFAKIYDIRKRGNYASSNIEAYAVLQYSKELDRQSGLEEAKNLLKNNEIVTVEEGGINDLVKDIGISFDSKFYFMSTLVN